MPRFSMCECPYLVLKTFIGYTAAAPTLPEVAPIARTTVFGTSIVVSSHLSFVALALIYLLFMYSNVPKSIALHSISVRVLIIQPMRHLTCMEKSQAHPSEVHGRIQVIRKSSTLWKPFVESKHYLGVHLLPIHTALETSGYPKGKLQIERRHHPCLRREIVRRAICL